MAKKKQQELGTFGIGFTGGLTPFTPPPLVGQIGTAALPVAPVAPQIDVPTPPPAGADDSAVRAYLDAEAARQMAELRAQIGFKINALDQQDAADETSYREALRRMQAQQPRDQQAARESANKAGLFYSGTLGKNLGDIATQYAQRQADAQAARQQRANDRASQKAALQSGFNIDIGDLAQAAAARQIGEDTQAADAGFLVRDLGTGSVAPVADAVTQVGSAQKRRQQPKRRRIQPLRTSGPWLGQMGSRRFG